MTRCGAFLFFSFLLIKCGTETNSMWSLIGGRLTASEKIFYTLVFFCDRRCWLSCHRLTLFMHQEKAHKRVKLPPFIVRTSYFASESSWVGLINMDRAACVTRPQEVLQGRCWGTRTGTSCQQDLGCTVGNLLNNEHSAGTKRPACTSERLTWAGRAPSRAFMKESGKLTCCCFI